MMNTPVWQPCHPEVTRMWHFMRFIEKTDGVLLPDYAALHAWSIQHLAVFWERLSQFFEIKYDVMPNTILSQVEPMIEAKWFVGARLNFAEQLLLRQDEHPALVCLNERGQRQVLTYLELRQAVSACQAGLKRIGVTAGDRVVGILPNTAYAVIAALAATSIGAIWAACSPDFGAEATLDRLGQIDPVVLFACDGHEYQGKTYDGFAKIEQIKAALPSLQHLVVCPNVSSFVPSVADQSIESWDEFMRESGSLTFASLPFDHPLYILFSSGTTGAPKCIVHGAGGTLLQHLKELGLHTNITAQDNLCFYTTCGWMMWNWMVSVLALGATLTLYEGSPMYPSKMRLFELIDQEKITVFGTSAKYISSVEKSGIDPRRDLALSSLKCMLSTGSPLLPQHYDFIYEKVKPTVQLSSMSGGTDIVSCFALGCPILPVYRGELQCLGLGMAVEVYNDAGESIKEACGELVCTKPFPCMPIGFWQDMHHERYQQTYFSRFPGVWTHGDFAEITPHHGLIIYGRSDATLNPGGVRIGTAEIYRQVERVDEVLESVVIGQPFADDVRVVLFVKLRDGLVLDAALIDKIRQMIRRNASPRHVPEKVIQVHDIPKTMNGKVVELAVRQAVNDEIIQNVHSLANPEALDEFRNRIELCD